MRISIAVTACALIVFSAFSINAGTASDASKCINITSDKSIVVAQNTGCTCRCPADVNTYCDTADNYRCKKKK